MYINEISSTVVTEIPQALWFKITSKMLKSSFSLNETK